MQNLGGQTKSIMLKYSKKRSLAKKFEKEYKLSAVDLQPSTDKTLNVN